VYKKGKDNRAANALSRQEVATSTTPLDQHVFAISTATPRWLEIVIEGYQADPQSKALLTELSLTS
jgi:hypothetical protein